MNRQTGPSKVKDSTGTSKTSFIAQPLYSLLFSDFQIPSQQKDNIPHYFRMRHVHLPCKIYSFSIHHPVKCRFHRHSEGITNGFNGNGKCDATNKWDRPTSEESE